MKKIFILIAVSLFLFIASSASAHQPRIIYLQQGDIQIQNPELSQAFYDELEGAPRVYFIDSDKEFELYINLLVPTPENRDGRYSAKISSESLPETLNISASIWQEFYEPFGRDYYLKGPELDIKVGAGKYKIEVYSKDNIGKYVLAVGKTESFGIKSLLNVYWQLPLLKLTFFKTSVLQFFLTPFGIGAVGFVGAVLILWAIIYYLIGLVKETIKHNQAKTLLLTSSGSSMREEILQLLQKPAYDVTVAFINTAKNLEENPEHISSGLLMMKDLGFNIDEVDIAGKKEQEVMKMLELKDIIYVAGGNTFYLLKAMRECNFEKVIRKLLKQGIVYIGSSAGSIVAGHTIKTAGWKNVDKNSVGLRNLKGLNLVPFDIFVHYQPEHAEIIKQQMPNPKKRAKSLRILTDEQAILVQGREVDLIGEGEAVVV